MVLILDLNKRSHSNPISDVSICPATIKGNYMGLCEICSNPIEQCQDQVMFMQVWGSPRAFIKDGNL